MRKQVLAVATVGLCAMQGSAFAGAPPVPAPPTQPPAQVIVVQPDGEDTTTNNNRVSGKSRSESRSESRNETSNSQNNIMVVPAVNVYEFRPGVSAPVTSINASVYGDTDFDGYGSFGGVVTVVVPLGGATGGQHSKLQSAIVAGEQLAFASSLATTCANLYAAGFTVNAVAEMPEESKMLAYCDEYLTKAPAVPVVVQQPMPVPQPVPQVPPTQPKVIRGLW